MNQESAMPLNSCNIRKSGINLLWCTCLSLLVQLTKSNNPQTKQHSLRSVLQALHKALIINNLKEMSATISIHITK